MERRTEPFRMASAAIAVVSFSVFFLASLPATAQSQLIYPGAEPGTADGNVYMVDASFEEVREFYLQAVGNPTEETGPGRTMRFVYDSVPTDHGSIVHRAVRISYRGNTNNACDKVFAELSSNQRRGFLTQARLDEIKRRYEPLRELYYTDTGDGPADLHIFSRYQHYLRSGLWMDQQEFMATLQRLMMEGKNDEVTALQLEMEAGIEQLLNVQRTAAQVDFWLECLDEIEAAAAERGFPLMIELEHTFTTSEGVKG